MSNILKLIISILIPQLAGLIGSVFTISAIPGWYNTLNKSDLNPPSIVFGPVWTILYILIGISLYIVWKKSDSHPTKSAIVIFAIQLILNTLWSIVFFGLKNPELAFYTIIVLWVFIFWNIYKFGKISRLAGYILIPYLLWVTFAGYLNYSIMVLN